MEQTTMPVGISPVRRDTLLRYYSRLPEPLRIDVHKIHTRLIRRNRTSEKRNEDQAAAFYYLMFLFAIKELRDSEQVMSRKARATPEGAKAITRIRAARIRGKPHTKRSKELETIRKNFFLVRQLREEEGMSWRQTARYLRTYRKIDISFGYLRQCYIALCEKMD